MAQSFETLASPGLDPRAYHTATLLTDGRALIAGGIVRCGRLAKERAHRKKLYFRRSSTILTSIGKSELTADHTTSRSMSA